MGKRGHIALDVRKNLRVKMRFTGICVLFKTVEGDYAVEVEFRTNVDMRHVEEEEKERMRRWALGIAHRQKRKLGVAIPDSPRVEIMHKSVWIYL